MEYNGCGNTEHRGLKAIEYCPDCHLAQISLKKVPREQFEQVLHCDGSLKGLAIPRVWAKMLRCKLYCQLQLPLFFTFCDVNHQCSTYCSFCFDKHIHSVYDTHCCFIHCEKSWRKTPPAWPDVPDSLVRGTENFFNMKIKLIRRRRRNISKSSEFPDGFLFAREGVFRQFSVNFPTHESSKASPTDSIPHPSGLQSTTLPLRHTLLLWKKGTALCLTFSVLV